MVSAAWLQRPEHPVHVWLSAGTVATNPSCSRPSSLLKQQAPFAALVPDTQPLLVAAAAGVEIEGVTDATTIPDKHDLSDAGTMEALNIARIHCDSLCSSTKAYFARG